MVNTKKPSWIAIKRVYRQHNSLVITLPMMVRRGLKITQGDYVEFEYKPDSKRAVIHKVKTRKSYGRKNS